MGGVLRKLGWVAAAVAAYKILSAADAAAMARRVPVVQLAHELEDAWADHHTVV
jgi:hypothetical protein